ncbi:MAG: 50S ribosomal protein L25 [Bacillota bacterium]|jgi:large subunit ribosomal protein L25
MSSILQAQSRELSTKGSLRKLREAGYIPGIIYGGKKPNRNITFKRKELEYILAHSGKGINTLLEINLDGEKSAESDKVMIYDIQIDPVRRRVIHVDYCRISMAEKVTAEVPLTWVGESQGVKEGGQLQPILRSIRIECLPNKIPNDLEIEVADLGIGDSITVADIPLSPDFTILNDPQEIVVQIVAPRVRIESTVETNKPDADVEAGPVNS